MQPPEVNELIWLRLKASTVKTLPSGPFLFKKLFSNIHLLHSAKISIK